MAFAGTMKILRKLRTLGSLDSEFRWLVLEALLVPVLVSSGYRIIGVKRTQAWLRRWALAGKNRSPRPDVPSQIHSVRRAQRIVKRSLGIEGRCLTRAFTLWALLLRQGLGTDLRVGFRKFGGKLEGHAWVEYRGVPLNEAPEVNLRYTVFKEPAAFDIRQKPDYWN